MSWEQHKRDRVQKRKQDQGSGRPMLRPAPMTPPQERYLRSLCERHDHAFDPDLSKREASDLIEALR